MKIFILNLTSENIQGLKNSNILISKQCLNGKNFKIDFIPNFKVNEEC